MTPPFKREPTQRSSSSSAPHRRKRKNSLPLLIFAAFGLLIISKEVPWVHDKVQSLIHPDAQAAVEICREAALRQSDNPDFTRLIKGGKATPTQSGFVVKNVIIGDLVPEDGEQEFSVTCHIDQLGNLANIHRDPIGSEQTISSPANSLNESRTEELLKHDE